MKTRSLLALSVLAATAAHAEQRGGAFPAGERYVPTPAFAPAQESRYHVQAVTLDGGSTQVRVPATGSSRLLVWTIPVAGSTLRGSLRTPDGRSLRADEGESAARDLGRAGFAAPDLGMTGLRGVPEVLIVEKPAPGGHELQVEGRGAALVVAAEPDSALTLRSMAGPLSRQPGEALTLRAELRDGSSPVLGASVSARLALANRPAGGAIPLLDDGRHADGAAGDGVYGALVEGAPDRAGALDVRFEASGTDDRGTPFGRTSGSTVVNEPGRARLGRVSARVVRGRGLVIDAAAIVSAPGRYRLDVTVAGAPLADGSRPALAWAEDAQRLPAGARTFRIVIPADRLPGLGVDALLASVKLLGYDPVGVAGQKTLEIR